MSCNVINQYCLPLIKVMTVYNGKLYINICITTSRGYKWHICMKSGFIAF